jgi:hypothetical protein
MVCTPLAAMVFGPPRLLLWAENAIVSGRPKELF